jgi:hypothetical protein
MIFLKYHNASTVAALVEAGVLENVYGLQYADLLASHPRDQNLTLHTIAQV